MKVKELLTDETKWCKGAYARDSDRISVDFNSPFACQWCLEGAIWKCYSQNGYKIFREIENHRFSVASWNDDPSRKFKDVKELLELLDI